MEFISIVCIFVGGAMFFKGCKKDNLVNKFLYNARCAEVIYDIVHEYLKRIIKEDSFMIREVIFKKGNKSIIKKGKYKLVIESYSSREEILNELEKIIQDALEYSENIDPEIMFLDEMPKFSKEKLIEIKHNIRMLRWKSS